MTEASALRAITDCLRALTEGRPPEPWPHVPEGATSEVRDLMAVTMALSSQLAALRALSLALADGRLDQESPPRMALIAPLKSLQSSLRHLTWQTQEVAAGNLQHHVDFLGDFSKAFNQMIAALRDKRRTEQEAMQVSKMASVGQLAAGLAHEINSPIQFIGDNLRYLSASLDDLSTAGSHATDLRTDVRAAIAESLDGVARVAKIVSSMKDFAPTAGHCAASSIDLHRAIENAITISQHEWSAVAGIERRYGSAIPSVVCHPAEINQVLLHLLRNAAQSIAHCRKSKPGVIVIATWHSDQHVHFSFTDDGHGVPTAIRERIFDPFFTTRDVGMGMGLGLTISRDIVESKHGGKLEVGGVEGEGAVFSVKLPVAGQAGT